jgi:hypothetical protein
LERVDWVYAHLVVNHFPVILVLLGAAAGCLSLLFKGAGKSFAYTCLVLGGLSAPVAFISGSMAEDRSKPPGTWTRRSWSVTRTPARRQRGFLPEWE